MYVSQAQVICVSKLSLIRGILEPIELTLNISLTCFFFVSFHVKINVELLETRHFATKGIDCISLNCENSLYILFNFVFDSASLLFF